MSIEINSWNRFQNWVSRYFAYPELNSEELQESHEEGKIKPSHMERLTLFRRRLFVAVLIVLGIILLFKYLFG
ncbi:hypothetical protein [Fulvivirga sp. M361]|uniref:hypothetical protein n=1 Tax=Fulvivirga sp. M361 TaxID=2594266 RepID=UPI00162A2AE8|nr:hypothetical protein [Fulvivirga sp. M361]